MSPFVFLPDGGFRLDLLTWWGELTDGEAKTQPTDRTTYDLLVGTDEQRCYTSATLEEFAEAVRLAALYWPPSR